VDERRLPVVTASSALQVPLEMTGGLSHPLLEKLMLPADTASAPTAFVLCERSGG
jgi:hypothetical protein